MVRGGHNAQPGLHGMQTVRGPRDSRRHVPRRLSTRRVSPRAVSRFVFACAIFQLLLACFVTALTDQAHAKEDSRRKVGTVRIAGNDSIPSSEIQRWMTLQQAGRILKQPFDERTFDADLRRVLRSYRREGFLSAEIRSLVDSTSTSRDRVDLTVAIREGPRAVLVSADFQVLHHAEPNEPWATDEDPRSLHRSLLDTVPASAEDSVYSDPMDPSVIAAEEARAVWRLLPGSPYRPREVAALRRELLGIAHRYGFADARVDAKVRYLDAVGSSPRQPPAIGLRARLVLGHRARIGAVSIDGLVKTRGSTVLRELTFHAGDILLPHALEKSRENLERTGLFTSVSILPEPPDPTAPTRVWNQSPIEPNRKRVLVRIEERRTGRFGAGVGYGSINRAYVTATIEQENFRGRGIRVQLDGIYAKRRRGVEAGAVFPWTFHRPIAMRLEMGYEKEEPRSFTAERLRAGLSFSRTIAQIWKGELGYQLERLDLLSGSTSEIPTRTKLGRIEAAVSRDTRRNLLTRPEGTYARVSHEWLAPWLGSREYFGRSKAQLRAERPLVGPVAVLLRGLAGSLSPQKGHTVPISERFFAGGTADLRGFPGDGIGPADSLGVPQGGRVLLLGTAELQLHIWKPLHLSGFVDAGELENEHADFNWDRVSVGAGGGLLARSKLGTLRAEVGFPLTDRFADGPRFHFSTGATFF